MELFGKDININLELNEEKQKWIYLIVAILIALFIAHLFVVKPLLEIRKNKIEYKTKVENLRVIDKKLSATLKQYKNQIDEYEREKENYEKLQIQVENASIQNNAVLKSVIQNISDYLNVEVVSIGAIQATEDIAEGAYEKKYIPYTVKGKGRDITQFFYYIENSEWLLTLKGSIIDISRSGNGKTDLTTAKFKLGAYYPRSEGKVSENEKETD